MDIGNLPIYNNKDKQQPKSRSFDSPNQPAATKNPWDEIGDYDEPSTNTNTNDDDDDEENEKEQPDTKINIPTQKEKQESDDAASIASQAAVKESQKNQLQK